jgi:hypothetical protein
MGARLQGAAEVDMLLDCVELLEDALVELIDNKKAVLAAKAQKIIKNKGNPGYS